jgi:hypothetical protein
VSKSERPPFLCNEEQTGNYQRFLVQREEELLVVASETNSADTVTSEIQVCFSDTKTRHHMDSTRSERSLSARRVNARQIPCFLEKGEVVLVLGQISTTS